MNDIFKDMQAKIGCEYISDLPSYKRQVWHEMKRLNLARYSKKQLEDFSKYVFGTPYQTLLLRHFSSVQLLMHKILIRSLLSQELFSMTTLLPFT